MADGEDKGRKPDDKSWEEHCMELALQNRTLRNMVGDRDQYAAKQKDKIQELEKQIAELQKQLAKVSKPQKKRSKK